MEIWRWVCLFVAVAGVGVALGPADAQEGDGDIVKPMPPAYVGASLNGRVTTASGAPLEGAVVSVIPVDMRVPPPVPVPVPPPGPVPRGGMPGEPTPGTDADAVAIGAPAGASDGGRMGMGAVKMEPPEGAPGRMGMPLFEARTDREGRFRMKVPFGRFVVRVSAPGFRSVYYENARTRSEAKAIVLDGAHPALELAVALEPMSTLSGRVTDEKTGAPVGVGVVMAEPRYVRGGVRRRVELKPDGSYLVEGLIPGVYRVQVLARGYLPTFYTGGESNGLTMVRDGDRIRGIDIAVSEGLGISGRVTGSDGNPMAGALLLAWPAVGEGPRQEAEAGADGAYRMTGLLPGTYLIAASRPGYGRVFYDGVTKRDEARAVRVALEDQPEGIDFQLKPVGTIMGRVTARTDGEPLEGAIVTAEPQTGGRRRQARTEEDGTYLISELATADYLVRVQAKGHVAQYYPNALERRDAESVRVLWDAHTTGVDLALGRLSAISGRITDRQGDPVADAVVSLLQPTGGILFPPGAAEPVKEPDPTSSRPPEAMPPVPPLRVVRTAATGEDGTYRIEDVPPGAYALQAAAKGFEARFYVEDGEAAPTEVSVGVEQEVAGIDVVLPRLGVLSGRVVAADEGALERIEVVAVLVRPMPSAMPPVAPVSVVRGVTATAGSTTAAEPPPPSPAPPPDLAAYPGGRIPQKGFRAEILDPEKGTYRIAGLPAGSYLVRASARGYVTSWYSDAESADAAERLEVGLDRELSKVDFALTRGGLISGYVLADGTGGAVPRAMVTAQAIGQPMTWRAQTDRRGAFELNGLPDGRYLLRAEAGGFVGEFYRDTPKPDRATPIEIGAEKSISDILFGLARRSPADFDGDGDVDFADLLLFLQKMMGKSRGQPDGLFDLNRDGRVDFQDFLAMVMWMGGAGKVAAESGALVWQQLEASSDEVAAGLDAELFPASRGIVLKVTYDPAEARFLGAEERAEGIFEGGTLLVHEEEPGTIVLAGGRTDGGAGKGDGSLVRLRFRPIGESLGVTLRAEVGITLNEEGMFVPVRLPEAQRFALPPSAFRLLQNVPNPFNPVTAIAFELPAEAQVELAVYNLVGQRVRTLVQDVRAAGRYRVDWDSRDDLGREVSSGVYFYHLRAGEFKATRRMLLLR